MKVLHVEAGRHLYGGALQVLYLLQGLRKAGVSSALVCPTGSAIAERARGLAESVHPLRMGGELDPGLVPRLLRVCRHERPDVVHLHSRRGADLWGGMAARLARVPVVMTRRVDNPEPRWLVSWKYRLYDEVIAISRAIAGVLLSEGVPAAKVTCVPSAVDTDTYRPGCEDAWFRQALGLPPDALAVAMVAQLIARKGHDVLLEAIPRVLAEQPRATFVLLGRGPLREPIGAAVERAGLAGVVRVAGFREDIARLLPCFDAVVHPARMEGLGVSLLQAAACGVPIVAARAGGVPEVVEDGVNGLLVEPGDAAGLARALGRLLADRALARAMGERGRALAVSRFGIPAMCAGNLAVYQRILARRGPARHPAS
jgi:glycosyltransferase involved in cell wall biosynthesis